MARRTELRNCPGADHFAWWLDAWSPGAADSSDELALHLVEDTDRVNDAAFEFSRVAGGDRAVAEVLGWRGTRFDEVVVTYRGLDGRNYDLVAEVEGATGRLIHPRAMRSANGADLTRRRVDELTPE